IQGRGNDLRGRIIGFADGGAFTAWNAPNSILPDNMLGGLVCTPPTVDPESPPCITVSNPSYLTSRSRHPSGVNSLLADGSVSYFADTTDIHVWRALASTEGDEVAQN